MLLEASVMHRWKFTMLEEVLHSRDFSGIPKSKILSEPGYLRMKVARLFENECSQAI